jgi:hypothetical protein
MLNPTFCPKHARQFKYLFPENNLKFPFSPKKLFLEKLGWGYHLNPFSLGKVTFSLTKSFVNS